MNSSPTYYNDLITRYFSGECSEKEILILVAWIEENEENRKIFEEYQETWLILEQENIENTVDLDKEWAVLQGKISGSENSKKEAQILSVDYKQPSKTRRLYRIISIAAVLIVLGISSVLLYNLFNKPSEIHLTAGIEKTEGILPDGSKITLSPGSVLTYPSKFKKATRNVNLQGEAYFEVTHDPSQPFIVSAGDIRVEVLGTSFYVNSSNADGQVEIILSTGKVAVYYANKPGERTIMEPGDKVLLSKTQAAVVKTENTDINYLAWKTGKLEFNNSRLDKVVRMLNKIYKADVRLADPGLGNCTITATFDNQSLDAVLNVIKETLSLKVKRTGNVIIISGNACE
jgi:transmembrane sensor